MVAVIAITSAPYQVGTVVVWAVAGPVHACQGTTEVARMTASQFSHEKFPDAINQSWVTMMMAAATPAYGCGASSPNGTISWVRWLAATSMRWSGFGSRWKYQLSGPGIGWVSWW